MYESVGCRRRFWKSTWVLVCVLASVSPPRKAPFMSGGFSVAKMDLCLLSHSVVLLTFQVILREAFGTALSRDHWCRCVLRGSRRPDSIADENISGDAGNGTRCRLVEFLRLSTSRLWLWWHTSWFSSLSGIGDNRILTAVFWSFHPLPSQGVCYTEY